MARRQRDSTVAMPTTWRLMFIHRGNISMRLSSYSCLLFLIEVRFYISLAIGTALADAIELTAGWNHCEWAISFLFCVRFFFFFFGRLLFQHWFNCAHCFCLDTQFFFRSVCLLAFHIFSAQLFQLKVMTRVDQWNRFSRCLCECWFLLQIFGLESAFCFVMSSEFLLHCFFNNTAEHTHACVYLVSVNLHWLIDYL